MNLISGGAAKNNNKLHPVCKQNYSNGSLVIVHEVTAGRRLIIESLTVSPALPGTTGNVSLGILNLVPADVLLPVYVKASYDKLIHLLYPTSTPIIISAGYKVYINAATGEFWAHLLGYEEDI